MNTLRTLQLARDLTPAAESIWERDTLRTGAPLSRKEGAYNPFRDQSEDRKVPKYLVQFHEGRVDPWEVVRAADRTVESRWVLADSAVARAVWLESIR